ncbi:signal recognition particle-docking protein FtsY [Hyphomicrobium denitrificans ATCC 51888]|uniref:Signal recognition particle receptor FtsY n=1 Tax=Hyphomicrobium denitrificans (strain ATCC 51888 / DSM 1869 / NCIMB 11706 / TK 0415) TaxID=582899 RepID=D8JXC9_HYPDA|nr:signal recognition particle-docking protein FtsY [Hyphomicrobium denitrificans]ADJ25110.1 signal recognition particle-docking protein FtsY [Hyphomicrobium denitrificans ATCC 51888]
MSEQREKGKGFFARLLGGSQPQPQPQPQPQQAEKPVEETEANAPPAPQSAPEPEVADVPVPVAAPVEASVAAPVPVPVPAAEAEPQPRGWFQKLKSGLGKTSAKLTSGITDLFSKRKLDAATLDDLEDLLIQADLGIATTGRITDAIGKGRFEKGISADEVRAILSSEVERVLKPVAKPLEVDAARKPHVIMMVGVNGTGKTTTIGKLAQKLKAEGKSVVLAAGDTFRAAAIDQLKVWGERTGCPVVARQVGEDASGLAFDALKQAQGTGADVLLLDTAGRLQNKQALMEELEKVIRVLKKLDSTAPHDVILVLDATTGQNALQQVEVFRDRAGVTGLVMTKLDGTARGGILVAIADKFGLPVHAIGVGEGADDLQPFEAAEFARAIAGT